MSYALGKLGNLDSRCYSRSEQNGFDERTEEAENLQGILDSDYDVGSTLGDES